MPNIYEYIKWRGDLEFDRDPFNPVDSAIFSALSYLPMDGIVPGPDESGPRYKDSGCISIEDAGKLSAEKYKKKPSGFNIDFNITNAIGVIRAIKGARRYKDCRLFGFINTIDFKNDKQFSAYCVRIEKKQAPGVTLTVFRGTDMNLAGWKEDLNMSFDNSVPAQEEAVSYLEKMSGLYPGPLIVTGHSKGGNLAIFASAFCNKAVQKRITTIYSNDGPGFHKEVVESEGYKAICGRIRAFIPQSSFVGLLFEHGETPDVIKSTAIGLLQHDMVSWEVTHNNFVNTELTQQSRFIKKVIQEWLDQIDEEQRERFIGAIYHVITAGNVQSIADFTSDFRNTAAGIINAVKNLDGKTKKLILKIVGGLLKTTGKNLGQQVADIGEDIKEKGADLTDRISRAGIGLLPGKRKKASR